jgi:hypothetical protein
MMILSQHLLFDFFDKLTAAIIMNETLCLDFFNSRGMVFLYSKQQLV